MASVQISLFDRRFLSATEQGQLNRMQELKDLGANVWAKDENGANALHSAAALSGDVGTLTWLLDSCGFQAHIEAPGQFQYTAFLYAAEKGELAALQLLKAHGANVQARTEDGRNALHLAAVSENVKVLTWLLDSCSFQARIEAPELLQRTAFLAAATKGHLAALQLLKDRGANVQARDKYGDNALDLAKASEAPPSSMDAAIQWLRAACHLHETPKGRKQEAPAAAAGEEAPTSSALTPGQYASRLHETSKGRKQEAPAAAAGEDVPASPALTPGQLQALERLESQCTLPLVPEALGLFQGKERQVQVLLEQSDFTLSRQRALSHFAGQPVLDDYYCCMKWLLRDGVLAARMINTGFIAGNQPTVNTVRSGLSMVAKGVKVIGDKIPLVDKVVALLTDVFDAIEAPLKAAFFHRVATLIHPGDDSLSLLDVLAIELTLARESSLLAVAAEQPGQLANWFKKAKTAFSQLRGDWFTSGSARCARADSEKIFKAIANPKTFDRGPISDLEGLLALLAVVLEAPAPLQLQMSSVTPLSPSGPSAGPLRLSAKADAIAADPDEANMQQMAEQLRQLRQQSDEMRQRLTSVPQSVTAQAFNQLLTKVEDLQKHIQPLVPKSARKALGLPAMGGGTQLQISDSAEARARVEAVTVYIQGLTEQVQMLMAMHAENQERLDQLENRGEPSRTQPRQLRVTLFGSQGDVTALKRELAKEQQARKALEARLRALEEAKR